ncbi:hypothetical protein E1B28_007326 [Marasmius oreades]|uniref:Peptidase M20 dimerisation domain-containing protein n=1 Tax=Marasmius oreades TaxID=181124 RepID=A0A9P7S231_9AGAR|nr:uncharacterized protein E1B28_007326 [Marasmius oreades]KAG7093667.1 hypothetical protein E1B28_007326 [Marasmius oreades]
MSSLSLKEPKTYSLPSTADHASDLTQRKTSKFRRLIVFAGLTYFVLALTRHWSPVSELLGSKSVQNVKPDQHLCPQVNVLVPVVNRGLWESLGDVYRTEEFRLRAIGWLSGAVNVPTESYDGMDPVGVDPRWETFGKLHEYLDTAFPLVHSKLVLTKHNTYGLLYEWKGSDSSLKPLLLMAHQDVVPVDHNTVDQWTHPPYSGYYDGERLWGRGSNDDKSGLIGSLSAIETLLETGFQPKRTVLLSYGFDEEASGCEGAQTLAKDLLEKLGENSIALIVDEGVGFSEQYGTVFALPGVAEKGYLDTRIEVATTGGHSSVPPNHTSIGILSKFLVEIESHPHKAKLSRDDIFYSTLQCYAGHAKSLPSDLRKAIQHSVKSDKALRKLQRIAFQDLETLRLVSTTQAIDMIQGGVKSNALPEQAWAIVNHRISTLSSVEDAQAHDTELLKSLAKSFNLTFTAFGQHITDPAKPSKGRLTLSDAFGTSLQPAPKTPTSGDNALPYEILSGTIKATYNNHRQIEGDNIAVSPGMSTGNTDTRYYWKLTDHIFRYNHKDMKGGLLASNIHTVNENIEVDAFLEGITFFTTLILNTDESTSI